MLQFCFHRRLPITFHALEKPLLSTIHLITNWYWSHPTGRHFGRILEFHSLSLVLMASFQVLMRHSPTASTYQQVRRLKSHSYWMVKPLPLSLLFMVNHWAFMRLPPRAFTCQQVHHLKSRSLKV